MSIFRQKEMISTNWPLESACASSGKNDTNLNDRIAKVGSDFWTSFGPYSLYQQGCPKLGAQAGIQADFGHPHGGDLRAI